MEIPLSQGRIALVDSDDYPTLTQYKWFLSSGRYAARWESKGNMVYMHDAIMGVDRGVDHIDRNTLNNTKANLRPASNSLQKYNRLLPKKDLPRGVFRVRNQNKYRARIWVNGKSISLGWHDTPEEASKAYREKAFEIHGEYPPEWE